MLKKLLRLASPWQSYPGVDTRVQEQEGGTRLPIRPSSSRSPCFHCHLPGLHVVSQVGCLVGRGHSLLIHLTDYFEHSVMCLLVCLSGMYD